MQMPMNKTTSIMYGGLLLLSMILATVLRVSHFHRFDENDFIGPDSARIIRQAQLISENGVLPEQDRMRSAPSGRSAHYQLTLFPYLIVWIHRTLHFFDIDSSLERIAFLSPVICFALACIALYLLTKEIFGPSVALLSVNLAAVLPVLTTRTVAGYVDRDGLCLFLGLLSYYFYFKSYHSNRLRARLLFAGLSGLTVGVLGLTWQGVALFSLVIVGTEIMRFLMQDYSKSDSYAYLCWAMPILLTLLVVKRSYHHFDQPFAFLAVAPTCLMLMFASMYVLSEKLKVIYILGMTTITLSTIIGAFLLGIPANLWENLNYPFGQERLAEMIGELRKKGLIDWYIWPGLFFFPIAGGLLGTVFRCLRRLPINAWFTTLLFQITVLGIIFSRVFSSESGLEDSIVSNTVYIISLIGLAILAIAVYVRLKLQSGKWTDTTINHDGLFLIVYFLIVLISARSAIRFDFFLAPIELVFGSLAIIWLLERQVGKHQINYAVSTMVFVMLIWEFFVFRDRFPSWVQQFWLVFTILLTLSVLLVSVRHFWGVARRSMGLFSQQVLTTWVIAVILVLLTGPVQVAFSSGYAKSSHEISLAVRPFVNSKLESALKWLKEETPQNAIIAASWEWGSSINLIANRTTIVDEEQIRPWVYMMYRHLFLGQTDRECLKFLETHGATHLLITAHDINLIHEISYIASDESFDREITLPCFGTVVEQVRLDSGLIVYRYRSNESIFVDWNAPPETGKNVQVPWEVSGIYLKPGNSEQSSDDLTAALLELRYKDYVIRLPPEQIVFQGKVVENRGHTIPCTLLVSADSADPFDWAILYLSDKARNSLSIELFLQDKPSDFFKPVYPPPSASTDQYFARIWEINYPQNLVQQKLMPPK